MQVPEIGNMLCPMHIPVLLCGFMCGWPWGLAVGFISPLLRGVLFGSVREKSRPAAYAVTALVFAGMHLVPYLSEMDAGTAALNGLLYVLPSLALCASYELGGTIWTPVLVHAAINGIGMLALRG